MKKQGKQVSVTSYVVSGVFRFFGFAFIIYDSLFRMCFNPKFKGDFGLFYLIIKVYGFFEVNRVVFLLGCCFFPILFLGSILWLRVCKKSMPKNTGTKTLYYFSIFVFLVAFLSPVPVILTQDYESELISRMILVATIAVFLIADVWNTVDIVVKHRKKLL